jgi:septal ring factor EnvC (AmiA/AmiB activator)
MDGLDAILKLFEMFKGQVPSGAGIVPVVLGAVLLTLTVFMKVGKYHLDKATTMSQLGATAVAQLQANAKLTVEELTATRQALAEANRQISELTSRIQAAMESMLAAERALGKSEGHASEVQARLAAAEAVVAALSAVRGDRRRRPPAEGGG